MKGNKKLDEITQKYYLDIYKYCLRRTNNEHDALDITQNVFMILLEKYDNEEILDVKRWLMAVAKKQVERYFRDMYKTRSLIIDNELEEDIQTASYNPFEEISEQELEQMILEVNSSLDEQELILYEAVFVKMIDYPNLAEQLNISQPALRQRVSRLKKKIKDMIQIMLNCLSLLLAFK